VCSSDLAALHGVPAVRVRERRERLFDRFGIRDFAHEKIATLSGGMKQKVSLIVSIAHDSGIIIFDEPTNGLDILAARTVADFLRELKTQGKTIILSTHIFSLAEKICDRVGIIIDGRMMLCGPLGEAAGDMGLEQAGVNLVEISPGAEETVLKTIARKNGNFLIIFPPDFEKTAALYAVHSAEPAPDIRLYYNSLARNFTKEYAKIIAVLNIFESRMANKFDINRDGGGDMAMDEDMVRQFLAMMFPMFLLIFIFHGATAAATESITSEKERGTLAALLVTPVTAEELAAGKILGIGMETFLCGISGALGTLLSMPKFLNRVYSELLAGQGQTLPAGNMADFAVYGLRDYETLLLVIFSSAWFLVSVVALVCAWAKTGKEAQMLLTPMIMVFMTIGFLSIVSGGGDSKGYWQYLIPIYNSAQSMANIFNRNYMSLEIALTTGFNILYAVFGCGILSRLFRNEKILF
jgi:energy-coupling factor transporter ATP-binding protein EcfA2/ABC-type transport system involved in multi-copper enzyme maturation permease subunit